MSKKKEVKANDWRRIKAKLLTTFKPSTELLTITGIIEFVEKPKDVILKGSQQ